MLRNIFTNFELDKLKTINPDLSNILILSVLIILCVFTVKRGPSEFLDRIQTEQLKGIGILFVIVGHLWVHVSEGRAKIIFSEDAIALFFLLSGYGLTVSSKKGKLSLKRFISGRIKRVMVPDWVATIAIIIMDYVILKRAYPVSDLLSTLMGVNVNASTVFIDYVRWYITLLLLWYFLFFIAKSKMEGAKFVGFLFAAAAFIFLVDYYFTHFNWYQIFSFPAGCMIGLYYDRLHKIVNLKIFVFFSFFLIVFTFFYKVSISEIFIPLIPWFAYRLVNEILSISFCLGLICMIALLGARNIYSKLLIFTGAISYELFLLHGVFLIKYNPIFSGNSPYNLMAQFVSLLIGLMFLAFLFQKGIKLIYGA
jgi:membrane-bound acyltransferase YfiQ involved in biofilm formation